MPVRISTPSPCVDTLTKTGISPDCKASFLRPESRSDILTIDFIARHFFSTDLPPEFHTHFTDNGRYWTHSKGEPLT